MRSSARRSTWRGSPSYGVRSGVSTSQKTRPTPCSSGRQGRIAKVDGSGMAIMSDSSIALKPVIEEPSKPIPFSNASSSSAELMLNDFSCPRMSVNQKRMKRSWCSSTIALTSSTVRGWSVMARDPRGSAAVTPGRKLGADVSRHGTAVVEGRPTVAMTDRVEIGPSTRGWSDHRRRGRAESARPGRDVAAEVGWLVAQRRGQRRGGVETDCAPSAAGAAAA